MMRSIALSMGISLLVVAGSATRLGGDLYSTWMESPLSPLSAWKVRANQASWGSLSVRILSPIQLGLECLLIFQEHVLVAPPD